MNAFLMASLKKYLIIFYFVWMLACNRVCMADILQFRKFFFFFKHCVHIYSIESSVLYSIYLITFHSGFPFRNNCMIFLINVGQTAAASLHKYSRTWVFALNDSQPMNRPVKQRSLLHFHIRLLRFNWFNTESMSLTDMAVLGYISSVDETIVH